MLTLLSCLLIAVYLAAWFVIVARGLGVVTALWALGSVIVITAMTSAGIWLLGVYGWGAG